MTVLLCGCANRQPQEAPPKIEANGVVIFIYTIGGDFEFLPNMKE